MTTFYKNNMCTLIQVVYAVIFRKQKNENKGKRKQNYMNYFASLIY